ncbi:MAG: hypothetical protein DBY30_04985 [Verrucomicrobia bacterium]|nr:MAG: hypothetical protein DBY30_04985 [Verrucomicrobiota bacterium]
MRRERPRGIFAACQRLLNNTGNGARASRIARDSRRECAVIAVLLSDAAFAAAAGIGFGIAFNPPKGKLLLAGLFAAVGHSLRLWLMLGCGMNICPATLIGAFAIGILGFLAGRISGCPSEIFTFPALLPMIPGLYAYKAVLAAIKFLSESPGSELSGKCLSEFFFNAITSTAIMLAIVIGAAASVFIDTLSARIENRKMLAGLGRGSAHRAGMPRSA